VIRIVLRQAVAEGPERKGKSWRSKARRSRRDHHRLL